jgi:hypothetical protein
MVSREGSVGIATHCAGRSEDRWGASFSARVLDLTWVPPSLLYRDTGSFSGGGGVKRPGRDADHTLPSSADVKERVELYLYSL